MSEYVSAEIAVNVGELPNTPGFKVSTRLGLGAENSGNIRNTFRDKTAKDLDDLTLYLIVVAKSEEGAANLLEVIQKLIAKLLSDEELQGQLPRLRELIARSDSDDFEGAPKFVVTPSVHNNHVIVQFRPIEQMREQLSAQLEMVTGLAGDVFERKQEIYFEFDLGRTFGDVVHSDHALVDLFESVCFKLWIHLHPQLFNDLVNLAENLGAPETVGMLLKSANLFNNANLTLNFKSATELDSNLKQAFEGPNKRFHENVLQKNVPDGVKRFFKHFADNGTGNVHLFAGHPNIALFVDLHLPGVSQFLSE
jgi:hypothetical protein